MKFTRKFQSDYLSRRPVIPKGSLNWMRIKAARGVRVVVVRPGFVRTKMTEGMDAAPFSTTPDKVAELIVAGLAKGKEESCIISQSACWACWRSVFGISTSW